jgi:hypothetical protein
MARARLTPCQARMSRSPGSRFTRTLDSFVLDRVLFRSHVSEVRAPAKSRSAPNVRTRLSLESGSRPGPTRSRGARPRRGGHPTNRDESRLCRDPADLPQRFVGPGAVPRSLDGMQLQVRGRGWTTPSGWLLRSRHERARSRFGARVHIAQQRCGQPATGPPCIAWRLSRPGGEGWRPCWLCKSGAPPIGQRYSR